MSSAVQTLPLQIECRGGSLLVAPPGYVILRKHEFHRQGGSEKHPRDLRSMLRISGDLLDRPALEARARLRGVADAWRPLSA